MASLLELAWTTNTSARRADVLDAVAAAAAGLVPDGLAVIWLRSGERLVLQGAAGSLRHAHGGLSTEFGPGDASPFGGLITTATLYRFIGTTTNTVDFNLNRTVQFSWSGQVIDLCAALS